MKARIVPYRDERHRLRRFRRFRERHHAISYLDNIVSAKGDGDPHDMAGWYRLKLLLDDQGCAHIIGHLRRELAAHREPGAGNKDDDGGEGDLEAHLETALTYFDRRRSHMAYAQARAANWGPGGLRGVMTARGLELSSRWDHAFDAHHATLYERLLAA